MDYDQDKDTHLRRDRDISSLSRKGRNIAKSDTVDMNPYAKAIEVTVAGTLKILPVEADETDPAQVHQYGECPVGFRPGFEVRRVYLTGTTAEVVALD